MSTRLQFCVLVLILGLVSPSVAAVPSRSRAAAAPVQEFDLYARGPYRQNVPRPEALLGYQLGARETTYWEQERVVQAIASAAQDRVRVVRYGTSSEGRPLRIVVITSPQNLARLEEIRARNARMADPRGLSPEDADELASTTPVTVWINNNVHGDESTSFESAMQVIYQLAASEEPKTLQLLEQCIVIVNPSFNPDGHERFAVYHNSIGTGDPHNDAIEHDQPWAMYGRFNHYRFDMNRDKLAVSQPEVRQEIAEYLRWTPHVYVDQHGEVDQYFFPPVALPINTNLDIELQQKWLDIFGRGNAAAFDRFGWSYYTRKIFDFHYAGYLDSWSGLNGAIGMTYETDGGGNLGFAWRRDDGTIITLRDGIAHHFVAAMATIETAAANRGAKLRDYISFRRSAIDQGRNGPMKRVVLLPGEDPERAAHLVATLRRVGIEVGVATSAFTSTAAHAYTEGEEGPPRRHQFQAGTYVVDLSQPQGHLARAILEPDAELNPEFVQDELAKRERNNRRGSATRMESAGFYDVTAWSLPYTYGVEAYWLGDAPNIAVRPIGSPESEAEVRRALFAPEGRVAGGRGTSGYVIPYRSTAAARLVLSLLKEDYRVGIATYELKAGGQRFPAGSFVLRTSRNPATLSNRIASLAREFGVEVTAVDSQYADDATTGIGSEDIRPLETPKIIVAAGDPVSQTSFGAVWFMLEREFGYPFTAMDVEAIPRADLSKFNVIVLPDGSPGMYASRLGKGGVEKLRDWASRGGTLVALGGASTFLSDKEYKLTTARIVGSEGDEGSDSDEKPNPNASKEEKDDSEEVPEPAEPLFVPGAIFSATLDKSYFLSYGYPEETIAVPMMTDTFFHPSKNGGNVVVFPKDLRRLSGFIWPKNTIALLKGTAYVIDEPTGRGHVILFAEDVTFRRLWHGLDRLFINSMMLAPGL